MKNIRFIILAWCVFLLAGAILFSEPAVSSHAQAPDRHAQSTQPIFIGGFDTARGDISSIPAGSAFEDARASLAAHYPQLSYTSFTTLTQPAVANVDIVILPATSDFSFPISPLTAAEQTALFDYVSSGGCAILMPDNQDFAPANKSLLDPFGMDITGMIWGWLTVPVSSPAATPVTSGFHGTVTSFTQGWPGGLTDLGPYATGYAANSLGEALAIIDPGEIAPGSGAVIVFSDIATFIDSSDGGGFSDNEVLFLNTIAFCQRQTIYLPFLTKE